MLIRAKIYEQPTKYIGTNKIINNFNGDIIVKPSSIMGRTGTFTIVSSNIPKYAYEILPEIIKVKFVQISINNGKEENILFTIDEDLKSKKDISDTLKSPDFKQYCGESNILSFKRL